MTDTTRPAFSYTIERSMRGDLRAETIEGLHIVVNGQERKGYALHLTTRKGLRGITASARVYLHEQQRGYSSLTTDLMGDFHRDLFRAEGRATEKAIRAAHERALDLFADALVHAKAHTETKLAREDGQRRDPGLPDPGDDMAPDAMSDFNYVGSPAHY